MVHLYALVRRPAAVPGVSGIGDAPLRTVELEDGIDAVVSDTTDGVSRSEGAIFAHAQVVEALSEANEAILPARFTAGAGGDDELRTSVVGRREQVAAGLDRVDGCVELGLRVLRQDGGDESPAASGAEYMRRRLGQVEQAQRLARDLHGRLGELARESTSQVVARDDLVLTAAYLLPRAAVEEFRSALEAVEAEHRDVTLVLTGPWPPYSFALLEAGAT
jgi:gas vesicle protein GvpL/GvpF